MATADQYGESETVPSNLPHDPAAEYTVGQLTRYIKTSLENDSRLRQIWVRGEASNVRLAGSGHLYFTLKDPDAELRVVYFGYSKRRRKPPADGEALLAHGDVRVYEKRGEYQLAADDLIKAGIGDLAAKFEALKQKLSTEGLFAEERKVALPKIPERIGVVTGLATAALRDVLNVLKRRAPYLHVTVFPASVQGDAAPPELIAALKAADASPQLEVILLVRGGGSLEDLWCFNDENLARALAEIERPVITGIGHEIDFTIADFVADRRAPTPSAAAELVAPDAGELRAGVKQHADRLLRQWTDKLSSKEEALSRLWDYRLLRDLFSVVEGHEQAVDDLSQQLVQSGVSSARLDEEQVLDQFVTGLTSPLHSGLSQVERDLPRRTSDILRVGNRELQQLVALLEAKERSILALDPKAPKKLGFALVWDEAEQLVRKAKQVAPGQRLRVEVKEGEMHVRRE